MGQIILEQILEGSMKPTDLPIETLREITNNFSIERVIGGGGFGTVYKGVLRKGNVAVKRIMSIMTVNEKLFRREVDNLMEVNHQNVVRFLGFCSQTVHTRVKNSGAQGFIYAEIRERLLCFEYISNGSLDKYITDELRGLDWDTRFQIIKGICMGLYYLHMEKHILHMDLKPANILLDNQMTPKITDFGLSRPAGNSETTSTNHFCTPWYAAPENQFLGGRMSVSSDIYSLGRIIIEVVTGHKGVPDNRSNVLRRWMHRWKKSGSEMQLAYQKQVTKCIDIGLLCQAFDPSNRPSISKIVSEIGEMESMNNHIKNADEPIVSQINLPYWEDDMLGVEPLELRFVNLEHKNKHVLSCLVELSNDTDGFIAFEIQTTSPLQYSIEPNNKILKPRSKFIVEIAKQDHDKEALHHSTKQYTEDFIVRSIKVGEGHTTKDINQGIFDTGIVDEVRLTVVSDGQLETPCVAEEPKEVVPAEYSCGLLKVHPLELRFPFKPNKPIACSLHLTNNTDECVAFRLQKKGEATWLDCLGELLMLGVVPPRSTYILVVTTEEMKELPKETEIGLILHSSVADEEVCHQFFEQVEEQEGALNEVALKAVCDPQEETTSMIIPLAELTSSLRCLDAHPTEPWIIIDGHRGQVHTWNYDIQSIERSFKASETIVWCTKIVARKQWVLAGDYHGYIHVYHYGAKPRKIRSFEGSSSCCKIESLAIHPTKPYLLSASFKYIDLWDWDNDWKHIKRFKGHADTILQVAFNPGDHQSFVSASYDTSVQVWNLDSPRSSYTLSGHRGAVTCLDFFRRDDRQYLITGSSDGTAKIWDMQEKTCIHKIKDLTSELTCIVSLPDRPYLLTGSKDGLVRMWSSSDYRLERIFHTGLHSSFFFREETMVILKEEHYRKEPNKDKNYIPVHLQLKDAGMEQDVPVARRRLVFLQALEQKTSPGGREVAGPRTPWSLHPTPAASPSSFNITGFIDVNPDPPPRGIWEGDGAPSRSPDPRERRGPAHHRGTPPSTAVEGSVYLHQKHRRRPKLLHGAAGREAHKPYTIYSREAGIPRPPAAGAADGGRGIRRTCGEEVDLRAGRKIASLYCSGREETSRLVCGLHSSYAWDVLALQYLTESNR